MDNKLNFNIVIMKIMKFVRMIIEHNLIVYYKILLNEFIYLNLKLQYVHLTLKEYFLFKFCEEKNFKIIIIHLIITPLL